MVSFWPSSGKTETTFSAASHDQSNSTQSRPNVYMKSPTSVEIGTQTSHHYSYPRSTVTNTASTSSNAMTSASNQNTSGGVIIYYSPEGSCNNGSSSNVDPAKEPLNPTSSIASSHQLARRPMSFMKALEMSSETPFDRQARLNSAAVATSSAAQSLLESASSLASPPATNPSSPSSSHPLHHSIPTHTNAHHSREKSRERDRDRDRNQFEMNYEISVWKHTPFSTPISNFSSQ